jgi:hypothetical protein
MVKKMVLMLILILLFTFIIYATVLQLPETAFNNINLNVWAVLIPFVLVGFYLIARIFLPLTRSF